MTRKSKRFAGFRIRRKGDIQYLGRCRERYGGPPVEGDLDAMLYMDGRALGELLKLTSEERERYKLFTIKAYDATDEQLADKRKAKDRARKALRRRERGILSRAAYLATVSSGRPWLKAGISRPAWYRRKAKGETGVSVPRDAGPCAPRREGETGVSARSFLLHRTHLSQTSARQARAKLSHTDFSPPQSSSRSQESVGPRRVTPGALDERVSPKQFSQPAEEHDMDIAQLQERHRVMQARHEESLAEVISPVGVAAVVLFIFGLICLASGLGVPA